MRRTRKHRDKRESWIIGRLISVSNFQTFFNRIGKIRNYKVQAEFFENLTPVQQKGRRVPITLQEKVDTEIVKLLKQGHIEKLTESSDK